MQIACHGRTGAQSAGVKRCVVWNWHRIFRRGQSKARLYSEECPSTTFADVAGVDAAKRELQEEVDLVTQLGMADELGPIYLGGRGEGVVPGTSVPDAPMAAANPWEPKEYGDEMARRIDLAVQRRIDEAHARSRCAHPKPRRTGGHRRGAHV